MGSDLKQEFIEKMKEKKRQEGGTKVDEKEQEKTKHYEGFW